MPVAAARTPVRSRRKGNRAHLRTRNTGYTGSDSFTYAVSDGAASTEATVTLNVHAETTSPTANAASYSMQHDQTLTETAAQGVLSYASDSDGDPLTAYLASGPANGTVTLNSDGSFSYTPNAGYTGSDSFQYVVGDGATTSAPATVTISVTDTGTPVANAVSYSVERNNAYYADANTGVLATDSDPDGDTLSAYLVSGPSNGALTLNPDGSFTYTPNANFTGTDSFTYGASDGVSTSAPATVTLTVGASAPSAAAQSFAVQENTALNGPSGALLLNDANPDNMTLTAQDVTQPVDGTVTVNGNGSFVYTPNANFTGTDSFTYDVTDGGLTSTPATVSINVNAGNTAPMATALSYSVSQNTSLSTDSTSGVLTGASDSDGDPLLATVVSGPSNGTLDFNLDGSFTYTPNAGFYGTDSFQYEAFDGTTYSSPATVTLNVTEDVPTVAADSYSVLPTGTTSVTAANGVLATASDPNGTALTASLVSGPADGALTLNSDGSFSYTPNSNYTGSDSFSYEAYNGSAYSSPATVSLTSAPVAPAQTYSVNHDTPLTVDNTSGLLTGAYDADGDALTAALATGPSNGTVTVNSDGSFTYTPNTHFVGTDSFAYTVSDGTQTSAPTTVTVDVTDSVPTAQALAYSTPENLALSVTAANGVMIGASDADGDSLAIQLVSGPTNGTLQLGSNGALIYTPDAGFFGTDTFTYDATDGVSTSVPTTVTITVDEVLPQANNDFRAVATGDFNNDSNPDFVAANYSTDSVSVFMGNGNGTFQTPMVYNVGQGPLAVAVGNFGNGYQDIAVANSLDNTVTILMNNGSGSFTTSQVIGVGTDPVSLAVGDFRGNGVEDVAVANEGSNTVSILQNNGSGTFSVFSTLAVGTAPDSVAAGDLNGDGKTDLVVANSGDNNISVLLSTGNDAFASAVNYAVGTNPTSVVVADLTGSGVLDVAVANGGSNNVSVLFGNGDGTLGSPTNYAVGSDPVAIAAGDFANTGSLDLVVVNHDSNDETQLFNIGGGVFYAQTSTLGESPDDVAVADFNKDGFAGQIIDAALEARPGEPLYHMTDGLAVSQDKNATLVAGYSKPGNRITIWNADYMKGVSTFVLPKDATAPAPMALSPNLELLAVGMTGSVNIYNVDNGKMLTTLKFPDAKVPVTAVAFSSDGTKLVAMTGKSSKDATGNWISGMVWNVDLNGDKSFKAFGTGTPLLGHDEVPALSSANEVVITKDTLFNKTTQWVVSSITGSSVQTWYSSNNGYEEPRLVLGDLNINGYDVTHPTAIVVSYNDDHLYLALGMASGATFLFQRGRDGGLTKKGTYTNHDNSVLAFGFNLDDKKLLKMDVGGMTPLAYKIGGDLTTDQNLSGKPLPAVSAVVSVESDYLLVGGKDGTIAEYWVYSTVEYPGPFGNTVPSHLKDSPPIIIRT